eukprot:CAMPEP_0172562656 /NCGR_PEP_ID=MMETSP1067-20121228/97823_1 /TAXON_ID=265564 ORGANISM="Thalassiosira punctigera, Strain Tpunct2005C2" /NCGR_SAMPLE_ID=MMETSP1067 /ASSEMBLY_ACC=CAM_ASM_000444 /LENGTH=109 /DNA_ID=CAMNT_0013352925 /DNA_START=202 /DNA_END=531 /DNA_ORIENTATION=-
MRPRRVRRDDLTKRPAPRDCLRPCATRRRPYKPQENPIDPTQEAGPPRCEDAPPGEGRAAHYERIRGAVQPDWGLQREPWGTTKGGVRGPRWKHLTGELEVGIFRSILD